MGNYSIRVLVEDEIKDVELDRKINSWYWSSIYDYKGLVRVILYYESYTRSVVDFKITDFDKGEIDVVFIQSAIVMRGSASTLINYIFNSKLNIGDRYLSVAKITGSLVEPDCIFWGKCGATIRQLKNNFGDYSFTLHKQDFIFHRPLLIYTGCFKKTSLYEKMELTPISITRSVPSWWGNREEIHYLAPNKDVLDMFLEGTYTIEDLRHLYESYILLSNQVYAFIDLLKEIQNKHNSRGVVLCGYSENYLNCHRKFISEWLEKDGYSVKEL